MAVIRLISEISDHSEDLGVRSFKLAQDACTGRRTALRKDLATSFLGNFVQLLNTRKQHWSECQCGGTRGIDVFGSAYVTTARTSPRRRDECAAPVPERNRLSDVENFKSVRRADRNVDGACFHQVVRPTLDRLRYGIVLRAARHGLVLAKFRFLPLASKLEYIVYYGRSKARHEIGEAPMESSSGGARAGSGPSLKVYTRNATGLVREIRLIDQIGFNLATIAPLTSGLIVVFFVVAVFPRTNLFLAILISGVASLPVWVSWALLTAAIPKTGGDYVFNSRILHPAIGFAVNLQYVLALSILAGFTAGALSVIGLNPTLSVIGTVTKNATISSWASQFTVSNPTVVFVTGSITIVLLGLLAALRSSIVMRVMTVMVVIFAGGAIVAIVVLVFTSQGGFASTFNSYNGAGAYDKVVAAGQGQGLYPSEGGYSASATFGTIFYTLGILVYAYNGAYLAGEVQRAGQRSRMLWSYVGAGVMQTVFLLLSLAVFYKAVGENFAISAAAGNQTSGIASFPYYAALAVNNPVVSSLLGLAFLFWIVPSLNVYLAVIQRASFVYAFEGLLPKRVANVNPRTHTPLVGVAIAFVLAELGLALDAYNANYATALTLADVPPLLTILFVGVSAVVMPYRRPDLFKGSPADWRPGGIPILVITGVASVLVGIIAIILPFVFAQQTGLTVHSWLPWATGIAPVLLLIVGVVWWYIARAVQRSKGLDLDLLYKTIPPD